MDLATIFRLDGKRALIVGGYGGIGRVTSELFAELGASIAIAGRSLEKAEELAGELRQAGTRALGARVDVADPASAAEVVTAAAGELGGLDVVVNMAAVDPEARAEEFDETEWQQALGVNLSGAFWLSRAAGRVMIDAGQGGRI
ncbi:MAG: SDR family NAD(P)-dependent oxidoreductase, partial [Thermoleophilaceae bacterium]|nr:SDR family NAD(P)-dependent oxidoreductase [Thermoleophilaceae bacterium]